MGMNDLYGDGDTEDEETCCRINKIVIGDLTQIHRDEMDHFENQVEVKRWLDWCRSRSNVICTEYEVPYGILPKGYNGVLIDVKVGGKKRVPDDKIYMSSADLRAKVARGNCVLELNKTEKEKIVSTKYMFLIFALRKFSGGLGDEDDSSYAQSQWFHYFIKNIDCTKKVIITDKENGEAAHISSVQLHEKTYFCIGSKNVHMLIRNEDDVQKYKDSRFSFARVIAQAFFTTFLTNPKIPDSKKEALTKFLQMNHFTIVAEILQPDHQHVVNLSYLKQPELRFICWTRPDFSDDLKNINSLCPLPINDAIDKAREFGLQTTNYDTMEIHDDPSSEIEEYFLKIRKDYGYEGKVLYFMDNENCTIGLIKKKTSWYIILRALREKVASFGSSQASVPLNDKLTRIRKRIKEIQIWLNFSDKYAAGWIVLSVLSESPLIILQKRSLLGLQWRYRWPSRLSFVERHKFGYHSRRRF